MLIDTHCHLDFKDFDEDRNEVLERSRRAGVKAIINVGSSMEGSRRSMELARANDLIFASIGIHPHEADKICPGDLEIFEGFFSAPKVLAVGEIGLDYYRDMSSRANQKKLFAALLEKARRKDLPVIVHDREAHEDTLSILKDVMGDKIRGVMHCFSGDEAFLSRCLDAGLHVSFTCNITFKNAQGLRDMVRLAPMDRIFVETDAPFLAPQDHRGRRNEPGFVRYAAEEIARIKGLSFEETARITTENAERLFRPG
ncbi:MAG: TatD family hydrolase [Candidatus Omnitrophota bacterium]